MKKKPVYAVIYGLMLAGYTTYALLDAFVIPHDTVVLSEVSTSENAGASTSEDTDEGIGVTTSQNKETSGKGNHSRKRKGGSSRDMSNVYASERSNGTSKSGNGSNSNDINNSSGSSNTNNSSGSSGSGSSSGSTDTDMTYESENVSITVTKEYIDNTYVYIADVTLKDTFLITSGLADGTFGRNITATTSEIAEEVNAVLAINGDFYGFRDSGYVMRCGYLYRSEMSSADAEDLVIYDDGSMEIIKEGDITAEELAANGAREIYSFGPGLIENGEISVDENDEVGQSMNSNPRTAIGYYGEGHYVFVVSDGRTSESTGLSLYQLAEVMKDLGVEYAYNLDGGGSSTMYFNGEVINNPTTNGNKISERSVSDIIYIPAE